ncbi:Hypothetical protein HDN1F_32290 [gamma proteobacterium HdN1]|nr:Hypothetical protein HDN1F_32290 [gamma proteobacterium HdN1]
MSKRLGIFAKPFFSFFLGRVLALVDRSRRFRCENSHKRVGVILTKQNKFFLAARKLSLNAMRSERMRNRAFLTGGASGSTLKFQHESPTRVVDVGFEN